MMIFKRQVTVALAALLFTCQPMAFGQGESFTAERFLSDIRKGAPSRLPSEQLLSPEQLIAAFPGKFGQYTRTTIGLINENSSTYTLKGARFSYGGGGHSGKGLEVTIEDCGGEAIPLRFTVAENLARMYEANPHGLNAFRLQLPAGIYGYKLVSKDRCLQMNIWVKGRYNLFIRNMNEEGSDPAGLLKSIDWSVFK